MDPAQHSCSVEDGTLGPQGAIECSEAGPILQTQALNYGTDAIKQAPSSEESHELFQEGSSYHPHLDVTRILCIACVCIDHGTRTFGMWNAVFAQNWVLQILFLISGIAYGMSRKSLQEYVLRLSKYVAIGVSVNWCAWVLAGMDWQHNFFDVVFQLWFVVALIGYAILCAPLKSLLQRLREESRAAGSDESEEQAAKTRSIMHVIWYLCGGILGIFLLFQVVVSPLLTMLLSGPLLAMASQLGRGGNFWGLPSNDEEAADFIHRTCGYMMLTVSNCYLILASQTIFQRSGLVAWAMIITTYFMRSTNYRSQDERFWHGFDLTMLGLVCYHLGLLHRRKIGEYIVRYWFLVIIVCSLLWPFGLHIRLDEHPPLDSILRARFACLECILIVCWLVAGERIIQKEIFTEDRLEFLSDWALLAYLTHKAIHILIRPPFNWLVIVGLAPVCYYLRRKV